jgi:hypothetical protein
MFWTWIPQLRKSVEIEMDDRGLYCNGDLLQALQQ